MSEFKPVDWRGVARGGASPAEIESFLSAHAQWRLHANALERTYSFANYFQTMAFVNAVAWIAHRQDHHPDMAVSYNRVVLRWNTHDAGGVSSTDFACATASDALLAA